MILVSFNFLLYNKITAQHPISDSVLYHLSLMNVLDAYATNLDGFTHLYNGAEYIYAYQGVKGHPYFKTDTLQNGLLFYDDVLYRDIPLKYDVVTGEVVIMGRQQRLIRLVPEKLQYFSIGSDFFIHIRKDSGAQLLPEPGFYQVLYEGPLTALVSRKKRPIRSLKAEDPYMFANYNRYYIRKDSIYYEIGSRRDLVSLFNDKQEISNYLRTTRANFKKNREETILKAVSYHALQKK